MPKQKNEIDTEPKVSKEVKFTKKQLLKSDMFKNDKDLIKAIFKDDKAYSVDEALKIIENFKKGAVK